MDFAFSADQEALRAVARDFLANEFPIGRVAELAESEAGWDPGSWKQIHDLGWLSLSVPEDDGGAGMGFLEEAVVFEETGRALYPGPVFSTLALARPALADSELMAPVLSGQATATLAWAEDGALGLLDSPRVHADSAGRLTGTKRYVPDLALADFAVVVADTGLYAVDLRENPGAMLPRPTLDRTRRLGDLVLDATPATRLPVGREVLAEIRLRSMAALACEAVGVGSSALDLASGLRPHPGAVRPSDRQLPGGQPPHREHLHGGGTCSQPGLLGCVGCVGGGRLGAPGGGRRQVGGRGGRCLRL